MTHYIIFATWKDGPTVWGDSHTEYDAGVDWWAEARADTDLTDVRLFEADLDRGTIIDVTEAAERTLDDRLIEWSRERAEIGREMRARAVLRRIWPDIQFNTAAE